MGTGTDFDANETRRQFREEPGDFRPAQLALQHHMTLGIDTVQLE